MKTIALLLALCVTISGCDSIVGKALDIAQVDEPTIVLAPGYKVIIDGKPTPIFGVDECPKADTLMVKLFGENPDDGKVGCTVLNKDKTEVTVRFAQATNAPAERLITERWNIVRESVKIGDHPATRTYLKRPDGAMVVAAQ